MGTSTQWQDTQLSTSMIVYKGSYFICIWYYPKLSGTFCLPVVLTHSFRSVPSLLSFVFLLIAIHILSWVQASSEMTRYRQLFRCIICGSTLLRLFAVQIFTRRSGSPPDPESVQSACFMTLSISILLSSAISRNFIRNQIPVFRSL